MKVFRILYAGPGYCDCCIEAPKTKANAGEASMIRRQHFCCTVHPQPKLDKAAMIGVL